MKSHSLLVVVVLGIALHGLFGQAAEGPGANFPIQTPTISAVPTRSLQDESTNVDVVRRYVKGCNTGDQALLRSVFTEDVAVYFVSMRAPLIGREVVAKFWTDTHNSSHIRWAIDHVLDAGNEVAIEWSSLTPNKGTGRDVFVRGAEWYVIKQGRIAEIRQYYNVRNLPEGQVYELRGFPYRERGYSLAENLAARVP